MTYDRYANRTAQTVTAGTGVPSNSVTVSATTNRITTSGYAYDASGNTTNDGYNTLVYDGESRTTSATNGGASGTYTYDGNNLRVKKVSGSTTTVYLFSGSKVTAEYVNGAAPTAPTREYIYSGATLLAKIEAGATKYYHQDHLSNRLVTDSSGNTTAQIGSYPYGESWYNASSDKLIFTSYERDAESGNDYAMARYYVSRLGRFASTDPLAGSIDNPQSLNRYVYVLNDPLDLVDPSGLFCMWDDHTRDDDPANGGATQGECKDQDGTWKDPWGTDDGDSTDLPLPSNYGDSLFQLRQLCDRKNMSWRGPGYWIFASGNCLYSSGNSGGLNVKDVINAALKQANLGKCLNKIFGPGNILNNTNLPNIDNTHSIAQISQITGSQADGTIQTPVPVSGRGTTLIASEYFGPNPGVSPLYVDAIYIHETGNILAQQRFGDWNARPSPNPVLRGLDPDTGQNLEDCVFGGIVAKAGTVTRNP